METSLFILQSSERDKQRQRHPRVRLAARAARAVHAVQAAAHALGGEPARSVIQESSRR